MTKNAARKDRFQKITEAIDSIYAEAAWRDRKGDHRFGMNFEAVDDKDFTSRSAGGPVLKTMQLEPTVHGIRGLGLLRDRLVELQQVELRLRSEGN